MIKPDSSVSFASPAWRISAISFFVLVLELALIRQVPSEVRAISYFTNLILMASFFGLGLGCILQDRRDLSLLLPAGLALVAGFIYFARGIVIYEQASSVHYFLIYADVPNRSFVLPLFPAAIVTFAVSAVPFIALGQALARSMNEHPRLIAYGWDIGGSLAGTILFTIGSFFRLPPWAWVPLAAIVLGWLLARRWPARVAHAAAGLLFLGFAASPLPSAWSPYYLVQHSEDEDGLGVYVNSCFHQFALNMERFGDDPDGVVPETIRNFGIPYRAYREHHSGRTPRSVLILGAGTGNDVNIAIRQGVEKITAVEIDPVILKLGIEHNASRPYDDPRVRRVVDDARHFVRTTEETYDLIIYGTLDSQSLLSGQANLRLENYVYTRESLAGARDRLVDGGMVAAYYAVRKPWLYGRIYATVHEAFGDHTRMVKLDHGNLFNTVVMGAVGLPEFMADPVQTAEYAGALPSTDDWPFLYLQRRTISPIYWGLLGFIGLLLLGVFNLLRRLHRPTGLHLNFLFLGLGFSLVEAAAIVRMALVFGSTWTVNAVVFASALLMIFIANMAVHRGIAPSLRVAWVGVMLALAVNFFVPIQDLLGLAAGGRVIGAGLLVGAPVFFAAVCFSRLFAAEKTTGYALGLNLIGAMAGGGLEYASMLVGMRGVWLLALIIYLLAFATTQWNRREDPTAAI